MPHAIFLGTAGYHPSETRHTACVFLPEYGIVLDAGTGFFRLIGRVRTPRLDILISHAHLDHIVGLTFLLDVLWKHKEVAEVNIYAAQDHLDAIREHLYFEKLFPVPPRWNMVPVKEEFTIGEVAVRTMPLAHRGEATGYRLTFPDGKTLAYITDTRPDESYVPLMHSADLAIHGCNFPDAHKELAERTSHSTTSEVARFALQANVKRLALFHFNPLDGSCDPTKQKKAAAKFPDAIIAKDLMTVAF